MQASAFPHTQRKRNIGLTGSARRGVCAMVSPMAGTVICISHATGAGGEEVGRAVAARLGLRYVDWEIVLDAARKEDVDPSLVAAVERRRSGLSRLQFDFVAGGAHDESLRELIRATLHETADEGDAVIVAHAASVALAGREGVLRVLVTASPEIRARRVAEGDPIGVSHAERTIESSDRGRADYLRRFYGIEEELPTDYDLVVNTDVLTPAQAATLVVDAAALLEADAG